MDLIYDPGLVLYLPLYKLDGIAFGSADKHGHLCTVTGALWTPQGRSFDGIDDYIDGGNPSALNITGAFTLEAWIYPTSPLQTGYVFSHGAAQVDSYLMIVVNDGRAWMATNQAAAYQRTIIGEAVAVVVANQWQHLAATRSGTTGKFYWNATLPTQTAENHLDPVSATNNLLVGKYTSGGSCFKGIIGEVRIYNRALTATEIQRNYLATKWRYR